MKWRLKFERGLRAARCLVLVLAVWLGVCAVRAEERIWVKAKINGKDANLTFDTGANGNYLYSDAAKRLELPLSEKAVNHSINGQAETTRKTKDFRLELFGQAFKTTFGVIDGPRTRIDGVIGWPSYDGSLVRADANIGTLLPLEKLPADIARWTRLEIDTNFGVLAVDAPNPAQDRQVIFIDTGYTGGVRFPPGSWRDWKAAHSSEPMTFNTYYTPGIGWTAVEEVWAQRISVGPQLMNEVPVTETDKANEFIGTKASIGTLGMAALRQLEFILDGKNHVAYLRTKETPADKYRHNRLGAVFLPTCSDSRDLVARVVEGGPAWEAGIRNGDILTRIGELDLEKVAPSRAVFANGAWEEPAGTKFKLIWRHGINEFTGEVVLKEILQTKVGK